MPKGLAGLCTTQRVQVEAELVGEDRKDSSQFLLIASNTMETEALFLHHLQVDVLLLLLLG